MSLRQKSLNIIVSDKGVSQQRGVAFMVMCDVQHCSANGKTSKKQKTRVRSKKEKRRDYVLLKSTRS